MNPATATLERRLLFWVFIGPCMALLALFVAQHSGRIDTLHLPVVAVIGLCLAPLWGRLGLASALTLLACTYALVTSEHPIFHAGIVLSHAVSFIITHLAFRQLYEEMEHIQTDSRTHLQRLLHLEEEYRESSARWQQIQEKLAEERATFTRDEQLQEIRQAELTALQRERDALVEEVRDLREQETPQPTDGHWREQISELEEQLEESRIALADARGALMQPPQQAPTDLEQRLDTLMRQRSEEQLLPRPEESYLLEQLTSLEEEHRSSEAQITDLEEVVEHLITELQKRSTPMLKLHKK
jgi:chromosome segregation ATPase